MERDNERITVSKSIQRETDDVSFDEASLLRSLQIGILETAEENAAFSREIAKFLATLDLDVKSLPSDVRQGLQKVSSILRARKISYFDETLLNIVTENEKIEERDRRREERIFAIRRDALLKKHMVFSKKLDALREAIESAERTCKNAARDEEDSYCDRILLTKKLDEYQQTVESLETDLKDMHADELHPKRILDKYRQYLEMIQESEELDQFLSQYKDLPSNLPQAKALLEAKQKEYKKLEQTFLERTD